MINAERIGDVIAEWFSQCNSHMEVTKTFSVIVSECEQQAELLHRCLNGDIDDE